MDMGEIANFKYYYRFEIMKRYLVNMDNSLSADITVLLKYDHIVNAWLNVKISTILNCLENVILYSMMNLLLFMITPMLQI